MSCIYLFSLFLALTFIPLTTGTIGSEQFLFESACKSSCTSGGGGTGNCISKKTKENGFEVTHWYCVCKYEDKNHCQSSCSTCNSDFYTGCQKCEKNEGKPDPSKPDQKPKEDNDGLSPGIIAVIVIIPILVVIGVIVTIVIVCCCCVCCAAQAARPPPPPPPPPPQPTYPYPPM